MRTNWRTPLLTCFFFFLIALVPPLRNMAVLIMTPVIVPLRYVGDSIANSARVVTIIPSLSRENNALKITVNELNALKITNEELKHENDLLRKELSLNANQGASLLAAQVIARSASVTQQSLTINKGINDGFVKGMPIMAQGYLIGRVDSAEANTSRVQLITSSESLLPVVLQSSRTVGLLRGGPEGLIAEEIPGDVTISPAEAVVTSNVGDAIKSGLPIGTVATILSQKSDVFQSVRITSPVDLSRLEVVFGVKP